MLNKVKELANDQAKVREWLERIGEEDENIIQETMNLMRTNPEYREFILDYSGEKA